MTTVTTSDGVRLHLEDEGDGRTVVLVGGFGMAAAGWTLQRTALRDTHRVVTVDRRSHGGSESPSYGHRMARHGKDLADVLDALELDGVLLVGCSMGASTALAYVDLFGSSRLRGLVLVDQTPKMVNDDDWALGMYGLTRDSLDSFVAGFPGQHNPFHVLPPIDVLQLLRGGADFDFDTTRALLRDHSQQDWRDVLPRVDVPLLAIAGRHSPLWPCQSSIVMAESAPDGRAVILEGSGHVPFLEEPDAFNDALLSFAAR